MLPGGWRLTIEIIIAAYRPASELAANSTRAPVPSAPESL